MGDVQQRELATTEQDRKGDQRDQREQQPTCQASHCPMIFLNVGQPIGQRSLPG